MNALLATAFVLGAAGSAHCVVMCGPIALAVPSSGTGWRARIASTLLMNSGRMMTYAMLGAVFGAFGHGLQLAGFQQGVSIVAGIVLLLSIVVPGALERFSPTGRMALGIGRLRAMLARNLKRTAPEALFFTGVLNGLLPCGLLYSALLGAAAIGSWQLGSLFMILFALGTWPAMLALRLSGAMIGEKLRTPLRRFAPVVVSAMAVLLILRGAELGIPYLSPPPAPVIGTVTACH